MLDIMIFNEAPDCDTATVDDLMEWFRETYPESDAEDCISARSLYRSAMQYVEQRDVSDDPLLKTILIELLTKNLDVNIRLGDDCDINYIISPTVDNELVLAEIDNATVQVYDGHANINITCWGDLVAIGAGALTE